MPLGRRRIWSETVSFGVLKESRVVEQFRNANLELLLAVRPWDLPALPEVLRTYDGIHVALWPMLADGEGRWASSVTMPRFVRFVRELVEALDGIPFSEVVVDLEPPIQFGEHLLQGRLPPGIDLTKGYDEARDLLRTLAMDLASRGISPTATVLPPLAVDHEERFARAFGTPVAGIPWEHINVMLYTSLLEGWSKGLAPRRVAVDALARGSKRAKKAFGDRAGVSLGAVGVGAFGVEPVYRSHEELREDVGIALDAGITDLSLLDLGGVLARPEEPWIEAFQSTTHRTSEARSKRLSALSALTPIARHSLSFASRLTRKR